MPNGAITSGCIENLTALATRRIDLVFGIGYGDDLRKAKEILAKLVADDPRILSEPAPAGRAQRARPTAASTSWSGPGSRPPTTGRSSST